MPRAVPFGPGRAASWRSAALIRSTGWMTAGLAAAAVMQAVYFVVIARTLGAREFGAFAGALAFVSLAAPFAGPGVSNVVVMVTAAGRDGYRESLGSALTVLAGTGTVLCGASFTVGYPLFHGTALWSALPFLALAELLAARVSDLAIHCYQAHERVRPGSIAVATW